MAAAPKTTVWKLDPHTSAKHAILKRYLQAWIPILTQGNFPKVAYVDGFAGPGQYEGGEVGSPIIAIRSALDHAARIQGKIIFLFVEGKPDRAHFLQQRVSALSLPQNFEVRIEGGKSFDEAFGSFRQSHADRNGRLPPTFAFIDPFGWTGAPFSVVQSILGQPSCEILVTFMYEEINRFIGHPHQEANFDSFFGTSEWRQGVSLVGAEERNRFFQDLYARQLRIGARARYVRSFQMRNASGAVDYYLFYATNNLRGLERMKEAMWKVDESGEFMFSDATDPNQLVLFSNQPSLEHLKHLILNRFSGREVAPKEIQEFVVAETPFRETHYKQQILRPVELAQSPGIEILNAPANRRRGTFGSSEMRIRFL